MPIRLEELDWIEFGKLVPKKMDTVILPIGTVEAHGVISLCTDTLIPKEAEKMYKWLRFFLEKFLT